MLTSGCLVEISGLDGPISPPKELLGEPGVVQEAVDLNGTRGQLVDHDQKSNLWYVATYNGLLVALKQENLRPVTEVPVPGEGGEADSYDVVIGPLTQPEILASEMVSCLAKKNFCVIRTLQSEKDREEIQKIAQTMEAEGKFTRLPRVSEEHMLGKNGKAKICNLDPEEIHGETPLYSNEGNISYISQILRFDTTTQLGFDIYSRSNTFLRVPLSDADEEQKYPNPIMKDEDIESFTAMGMRSKLGILHFHGPSPAKMTLEPKTGGSKVELSVGPNIMVLWRSDLLDHSYECDGPSLALQSFYMEEAPRFTITAVEGDLEALGGIGSGPAAPPGEQVSEKSIATRYPGQATDPQKMWVMQGGAGGDLVVEIPFARFDYEEYYDPSAEAGGTMMYMKHGSFIDGVENFDNRFFNISAIEAKHLDPMQRHSMEVGWEAMAAAGFVKEELVAKSANAGVFVGIDKSDWGKIPQESSGGSFGAGGGAIAIIANRLNFIFNMKGPSMVMDTACSASLVATHGAKLYLKNRVADPLDFCLTIGINLNLSPLAFIMTCAAGMLTHQGRCFTFDSSADGYLRGDGVGAHVITLSNSSDRLAVLAGSQVNQDGRSASLTAPNGPSQERCILAAFREASLSPSDFDCMECHGTGTALGDPIEVGAQRKVMSRAVRDAPLFITTTKSNFGHIEGGAGVAGLIKCINGVIRTQVASNVHLRTLNPHLDTVGWPAMFLQETQCMYASSGYMGVSSFGFGGTNAHGTCWGKCIAASHGMTNEADVHNAFIRKLQSQSPHENSLLQDDSVLKSGKPGDRYTIALEEGQVVWNRVDDIPRPHENLSLTGTFNNWGYEELVANQEVDGFYTGTVIIGSSGEEEFNICMDMSDESAFMPVESRCSKRSAPILGPKEHSKEKTWVLRGKHGDMFTVEFFRSPTGSGSTISWRKMKV